VTTQPETATPRRGLPFADIRVVALEQAVAGPLCTRHLADLGADVVKIERPDGGDFARSYDSAVHGHSAYFAWLNRGKRSVVLDLRASSDRELLVRLVDGADVFVHNLGPGSVARLGFDRETLLARWPALISCAISGYGDTGPYRDRKGFDLLLQGESGLISTTGTPEHEAKVGISIADIAAGMYALSAIMAALRDRDATGIGAQIEISMLDCLAEWMTVPGYYAFYQGAPPKRSGMRHGSIVPYGPYAVSDGYVNLAVQTDAQWVRFCTDVLVRPELIADERFATNQARVQNREALETLIEAALGVELRSAVVARLDRADIPFGDVNDVFGLIDHAQLAARERWFEFASSSGPIRAVVPPFGIAGLPLRADPLPELGEHTESVIAELDQRAQAGEGRASS
jgi:itaconate CoA-transferase